MFGRRHESRAYGKFRSGNGHSGRRKRQRDDLGGGSANDADVATIEQLGVHNTNEERERGSGATSNASRYVASYCSIFW